MIRITTINVKGKPFTHSFATSPGGKENARKLWEDLVTAPHILIAVYFLGDELIAKVDNGPALYQIRPPYG